MGRDRIRLVQLGDRARGFALPYPEWKGVLEELVPAYAGNIVLWNALFDLKFLARDGIKIPQRWVHDGMIMAHLHDPVRSVALKQVGPRLLGSQWRAGQSALKDVFRSAGWDFDTVPVDHPAYWQYSALDTVLTARTAEELWPRIAPYREPYELEMAFIHVLRDAEVTGMVIDLPYCRSASAQLQARAAVLKLQIDGISPINPLSESQVVSALQVQGAVLTKRTEKGNLSVDDDVLKSLGEAFPLAGLILEYRRASYLLSNFFVKLDALSTDHGGHVTVHPSTHPVGARTGRTSVTEPPLQTVPRGRAVRDAFVARPGHRLILADYDGMEMRFMAGDARCHAMLEAFARGEDVHTWVASQVHDIAAGEVTRGMRELAKNAAFAKIYCAGVEKFATTAGIGVQVASDFLSRYDELFPEVSAWQGKIVSEVSSRRSGKSWGYVETTLGRHLPCEPGEEYKAVNYRDQGSCAEIAKAAAVRLANAGLGDYFRLFVHDELICEAPEEVAAEVAMEVATTMEDSTVFEGLTFTASAAVMPLRWGDKYGAEPNPLMNGAQP
mgnify:CR=1 FL=1